VPAEPARPIAAPRASARWRAAVDASPVGVLVARFFPQGALLLSVLTFGSYVMGLVRDRTFARTFGAGEALDAYNAAFAIPEIALGVLVASGLSAPFIPLFLGLKEVDEEAAQAFGSTILSLAIVVIGVVTPVLFVIAPWTVDLVAPRFTAEQRELYTALFRVMLLTPLLFAISDVLGEVLVAERRFLAYALAPLLYNGGIVIGTVMLADRLGIYAAAVGAVLGAVLHLAIRVSGIRATGFRVRPRWAIRTPAIREFGRLMVPKMLSHPIDPVTFTALNALASSAVGGISALSFARNFQSVPVTVIGISFALAAFPPLATAAASGDRPAFGRILGRNAVLIVGLTTAAAVTLVVVGHLAIGMLLGGGAFDEDDVTTTTILLAAFSLAIPFESLTHLLSRAIFATRNTALQVAASLAGFGVTVVAANVLSASIGLVGIPLGFTLGMVAKTVLLCLALVPRIRAIGREFGAEELVSTT